MVGDFLNGYFKAWKLFKIITVRPNVERKFEFEFTIAKVQDGRNLFGIIGGVNIPRNFV